jgi:hypothetical protein
MLLSKLVLSGGTSGNAQFQSQVRTLTIVNKVSHGFPNYFQADDRIMSQVWPWLLVSIYFPIQCSLSFDTVQSEVLTASLNKVQMQNRHGAVPRRSLYGVWTLQKLESPLYVWTSSGLQNMTFVATVWERNKRNGCQA